MKKLSTLIPALLFFFFVEAQPKKPIKIEVFNQGGTHSTEFTSNRFSAINISKDGIVWAGTIYEGLYRYDAKSTDPANSWKKSTVARNLFINDIKPDKFGGIWVAQSGNRNPGGSHIEGGVNHIPDAKRDSVVFYSITGTQTTGYFYSRNLLSLCITEDNRTDPRALPTDPPESVLFAAQGLSRITGGGDIIRGGMNTTVLYGDYTNFYRNAGRAFVSIVGATYEKSGWDCTSTGIITPVQISKPYAECVGGHSKKEVWVAVRDNYGMTEIVRYLPDGTPKGREASYNHTNSTLSQYSQPRAIHFDEAGNKWITTRYDGIMVLVGGNWTQMKLHGSMLLPAGAVFNRNAIAEDEWGNVYFGTDAGLLVYKPFGFNSQPWGPTSEYSYELFTTEDGLPGNNITGLAYDKINGKLLLTADGGGVAFVDVKPDNIEGVVFDVYTDIIKKGVTPPSNFKTIPVSGAATVKLFKNGEEIESIKPDNYGYFHFSKEKPGETYSVEVEFTNKDKNKMKYTYKDVKSRSKVPPAYFPDSLIRELKVFKDSIATRHVDYKVMTVIPVTSEFKGFYTENYDAPYAQFWDPAGINENHAKKVYNLGIYLANLKTVYDLGTNVNNLAFDGMDNGWAVLKVLKGMVDLKITLDAGNVSTPKEITAAKIKMLSLAIKTLKDAFCYMLDFSSKLLLLSPEVRPLAKSAHDAIEGAFNFLLELVDKGVVFYSGNAADIIENIMDLASKVISVEIGGRVYSGFYARAIHSQLVPLASAGSVLSKSELTYADANYNLVYPYGESLLNKGKESFDTYNQIVTDLKKLSKWADRVDQGAMLATTLAAIPFGQPIAVIAIAVAKTAKITQFGALGSAMAVDYLGIIPQVNLSRKALNKSGINGLDASYLARKGKNDFRRDPPPPSQKQPIKLLESKNKYNEKLSAFQATIGTANFTNEDYLNRINDLNIADSIYMRETHLAFENLMASVDSAIVYIPDFDIRLDHMMDSFVYKQPDYKYAFFLNQFAILNDLENKANYLPGFDSLANELKLLNDSIYSNFVKIIDLINENAIEAPAYLSQSDYALDHGLEPGTPGKFTNTYTNYGIEVMRNVSFKINQPTDGFNITSTDSIFVGDIAPGASIQVSYNFSSPLHTDSITMGRYEIDIKAENGKYQNTTGSLVIIARGPLPVTLINFEVNCTGTNTQLSWETTSESNSSHFEIEKSSNSVDWIVVRRITTAGNSDVRRLYKLLDQASENSFYRLKHIDKDGQFTYSNVLRSKCSIDRPMISVYPVPAKDVVNVVTIATKASIARVVLLDIAGREVRRLDAALQPGDNIIRIKTSDLSSGHYILRFDGAEINKTVKITINK